MNVDVATQVRDYAEQVDAMSRPVDLDRLPLRAAVAPRPTMARGLAVAVVAAIVVGILAMVTVWLSGEEIQPADTSIVPTTIVDSQPVPLPNPDTRTDSGSLTNDFPTVPYSDIQGQVGTWTWTKLEGDADTVPNDLGFFWQLGEPPFFQEADGSYVFLAANRTWRSVDGLVWSFEEGPPVLPDAEQAWEVDGLTVTLNEPGGSQDFDLPEPNRPQVEGIDLELVVYEPQPGDELVYVAGSWEGRIPWDEIYGTVEICEQARGQSGAEECFPAEPVVFIGEVWIDNERIVDDDRAWVFDPHTDELIATLEIVVSNYTISFLDTESQEPVHEITSATQGLIGEIVMRLPDAPMGFGLISRQMGWIGSATAPFVVVSSPPGDPWSLVSLPRGGFGQFSGLDRDVDYEGETPSAEESPLGPALISTNGVEWMEATPNFVNDGVWEASVRSEDGLLLADVVYRAGGAERWTSTNGIDWTRQFQLPANTTLYESDDILLTVAMRHVGLAVGQPELHTSIDDGQTWAVLPSPPGDEYHDYEEGSWENFGVAGDLVWIIIDGTPPNETKIMWIGKFE